MTRLKVRPLLIYLLPILHFCACLIIAIARLESGWEYMMIVDLPASVLIMAEAYNFDHPFILFGIFGTLWWYLLSRGIEIVGRRVIGVVRKHRGSRTDDRPSRSQGSS
jgi:hypothetical protein